MVMEYYFLPISLISSDVITNKTLIRSLLCKRRSSYFLEKTPQVFGNIEINAAVVSQT